jgi:hypothetical protein
MKKTVCLATALYEKTYQHYIDNDKLSGWIGKLNYEFDEIIIMFNNISEHGYNKCLEYLNSLEIKNINHYRSSDIADDIISRFGLPSDYRSSSGFNYSAANFSQIILSKSEYLIYICEDISIVNDCHDFIKDSIYVIDSIEDCLVTAMNWSYPGEGLMAPQLEENDVSKDYEDKPTIKNDKFYLTDGFGDHLYFSSMKKLSSIDYTTSHPIPAGRYPGYSGESFDKRLNYFMFNNKLYRYVSKNSWYSHVGWKYYLEDVNL